MYLEEIKCQVFDHGRPIIEMDGEQVLKEYLYILSGFADTVDDTTGTRLGLAPALEARKRFLEGSLIGSFNYRRTRLGV